jgi:hypothetical protein
MNLPNIIWLAETAKYPGDLLKIELNLLGFQNAGKP